MTTHEAKKDCAVRLSKLGFTFSRLQAKTVNFQDLARCSPVFVTVYLNGAWPQGVTEEQVTEGVPKPSEGGYCVQYRKDGAA